MNHKGDIEKVKQFHFQHESSPNLHLKIVSQLKEEKLITTSTKSLTMNKERIYWIAATLAGIILGFFIATYNKTDPSKPAIAGEMNSQYLLLLREDSTFNASEGDIPRLIKEYTNWSTALKQEKKLVSAEKLSEEMVLLGNSSPSSSVISGYFLIIAGTLDEAERIANSHPHLRYNGSIEVRPIEQLN